MKSGLSFYIKKMEHYSSIQPFLTNDFEKTKIGFLNLIGVMLFDLKEYSRSKHANEYQIQKTLNYIDSANNLIKVFDTQNDLNIEIIKKQALIIEINKIKFPTISQPVGLLKELYLESKGRIDEVGNNYDFHIEMPII